MTFPHTATIQENVKAGGQYTWTNTVTTACWLQPLDDAAAQLIGATFGKSYYCYLPYTADVTEKKRLVIDGEVFGVKGVKAWNYGQKHKRAALEQL